MAHVTLHGQSQMSYVWDLNRSHQHSRTRTHGRSVRANNGDKADTLITFFSLYPYRNTISDRLLSSDYPKPVSSPIQIYQRHPCDIELIQVGNIHEVTILIVSLQKQKAESFDQSCPSGAQAEENNRLVLLYDSINVYVPINDLLAFRIEIVMLSVSRTGLLRNC